ncbi:hypothetical protein [Massilia sp. YIM B02769]|nr:hypothetical protein [Massilia sp. YIM B02769]
MLKLFSILFFGSVTYIGESPTDINAGINDFQLQRPISAITSNASIQIDVTSMLPASEITIHGSREWFNNHFAKGCVKAVLYAKGNPVPAVVLDEQGIGYSSGEVKLILSNSLAMPLKQEFSKLTLTSCKPMSNVSVSWQNYHL